MRLRRMLSFMADVEAQTQMLFLSGSPVVMAKSLCCIKESGEGAATTIYHPAPHLDAEKDWQH